MRPTSKIFVSVIILEVQTASISFQNIYLFACHNGNDFLIYVVHVIVVVVNVQESRSCLHTSSVICIEYDFSFVFFNMSPPLTGVFQIKCGSLIWVIKGTTEVIGPSFSATNFNTIYSKLISVLVVSRTSTLLADWSCCSTRRIISDNTIILYLSASIKIVLLKLFKITCGQRSFKFCVFWQIWQISTAEEILNIFTF